MKYAAPLLTILVLAGCATTKTDIRNDPEAVKYDPATSARIRIITSPNTQGYFVSGQTCEQFFNVSVRKDAESDLVTPAHPSGGLSGMLTNVFRNNVIGMPASIATREINSTPRFYDEHVVPAGKPLIVRLYYRDSRLICRPAPRVFTPQPGVDYEFEYLEPENGFFSQYKCTTAFRTLNTQGSTTTETPTETAMCIHSPDGYHTVDLQKLNDILKAAGAHSGQE